MFDRIIAAVQQWRRKHWREFALGTRHAFDRANTVRLEYSRLDYWDFYGPGEPLSGGAWGRGYDQAVRVLLASQVADAPPSAATPQG